MRIGETAIRAGLETLWLSGGHRLAQPFLSGVGAILTFHHVRPAREGAFQPNRSLEITPDFLDELIGRLVGEGLDLVTLDEALRRLQEADFSRRFVVLTFDDGYRDFAAFALPVLKRHGVPATLFVPSSFADGHGALWWVELERAIAARSFIEIVLDGEERRFDTSTAALKAEAFAGIYWSLRRLPEEAELRRACRELALDAGIDVGAICGELCMDWRELEAIAGEPLVTIGAHTDAHVMLRKWSDGEARREMATGTKRIEERLGIRPLHFSFPVGDPTSAGPREFAIAAELGFRTAVTTRPGVLFPDHREHPTALPRISVNGNFQKMRYLDVLLSGAPTALMNRFRRVSAA